MAISAFNFASNQVSSTAGPVTVAYGSNNTSGNLLVATIWATQFSGITDSAGNTWVNLFTSSYTVSGAHQYIYYVLSAKPGANTVSLTFTGSGSFVGVEILEASGGTWTVDGTATGSSGASTSPSSGSMSITGTNDLLIGQIYDTSGVVPTPGSGWTIGATDPFNSASSLYQIVTSAGSYAVTGTYGAAQSWMADIGAFTASGGGGNVNVPALSGSILVTGTANPVVAIPVTALTGSIGVTGAVFPTTTGGNANVPALTGSIGVTGSVHPQITGGGGGGGAPLPYSFWGGGHS